MRFLSEMKVSTRLDRFKNYFIRAQVNINSVYTYCIKSSIENYRNKWKEYVETNKKYKPIFEEEYRCFKKTNQNNQLCKYCPAILAILTLCH